MAILNKTDFEAKYVSNVGGGAIFKDNTTGDISALDMRNFADDIADSLGFITGGTEFWPLSGTGTLTGNVSISGSGTRSLEFIDITSFDIGCTTLAIATGGATRLTFESDGSWNIGGSNGTSGQVLTSNGSAAAPTWQASGGISGLTTNRIPKAASATTLDDSELYQTSSLIGLGTTSPDRKFHIEVDDATNNAVTYLQRLTHTTSGSPANGIGVGIEFEIETSASNNEIGATIEALASDVTAGNEEVDTVFRNMLAGTLRESLRITPLGSSFLYTLGSTSPGATRSILADGSDTNVAISLTSKGTGTVSLANGDSTGYLQITSTNVNLAAPNRFDTLFSFSSTATVDPCLRIHRETTGTAAAGIGARLEYSIETAPANGEIGVTIDAVATDVTSTSEDFDCIINTMAAGATAAERARINVDGIAIPATAAYYIGPVATNGSWRFIQSGDDLLVQQRESGTYNTKHTFSGA